MSCERLRITWKVAWWEFNRFFKLKDMVKGLLYMVLGGAIGGAVAVWLARGSFTVPDVAVADYGVFEPQRFQGDEIRFINHVGTPFESLLEMLDRGEVDAVLSIRSADEAEIRMPSDRSWVVILEQLINELRTEHQLRIHGGVLMWNSFLAGVAATIDDPNSSQRAAWMFLPLLPVLFASFTLVNPDTLPIRVLGMLPLTSYAVLPARMVLTQVPWWEPVVALALLAGAAWVFRLVAGKIFSAGMMMYGKEPTLKEMAHWFRRAR